MNIKEVKKLIGGLYKKGDYRPVGVFIIYNKKNKFLMIRAKVEPSCWNFPQGGIERGEGLQENLERELFEEVGIDVKKQLSNIKFLIHYKALDTPGRKRKRGFKKGKGYFYSLAKYTGKRKLKLQAEEVLEAKWLTYNECLKRVIGKIRPEKVEMVKEALNKAMKILKK